MKGLFASIMAWVRQVCGHIFTGQDNATLAIGRVMAIPYAIVGWALPFVMLVTHQAFSLGEAGVFLVAHAGGFMPLITGTASTEPKP